MHEKRNYWTFNNKSNLHIDIYSNTRRFVNLIHSSADKADRFNLGYKSIREFRKYNNILLIKEEPVKLYVEDWDAEFKLKEYINNWIHWISCEVKSFGNDFDLIKKNLSINFIWAPIHKTANKPAWRST